MNTVEQAMKRIENDKTWGNASLRKENAHVELEFLGEDEDAFLFRSWVIPNGKTLASCTARERKKYSDYDLCVAKSGESVTAIIED